MKTVRSAPLFAAIVAACCLCLAASALAHTPLGGLTPAISPDGKTLVVGGDNRVLYIVDPATFEIKDRVWFKTTIWRMAFNKDGSKLLVEDTSETLYFLDPANWTVEREVKKSGFMAPAYAADICAVKGGGKEISVISMTDAASKMKVDFEEQISSFGLNADGTRLAVISRYDKDTGEENVKYSDIPKDLKGIEKAAFQQRNDGKTANLYIVEVPSGKILRETQIFYTTSDGAVVFFHGDTVMVVNYSDVNAKIPSEGEIEVFKLGGSNYGIGISRDQKRIATGGMRDGQYTKVDGMATVSFKTDRLSGWPEYFKGFCFDADGNAYGTTSGYRLFKIEPGANVAKSGPVF